MNPDVLPVLFHKQIENWKTISEAHFLKVSKFSVDILISMLEETCSEELIIDQLELIICKASEVAEKKGLSELKTRIKDLTSGHLQTNNPAFEDRVRKVRRLRFRGALERFRLSCIPAPVPKPAFNLVSAFTSDDEINAAETITINTRNSDLLFDELHISNAQNLEDEIHDILKAYYEIARDEFVEYVNKLIVEPYLNSPDGPVLLFSPIYVGGLSDDKIESLGAESFSLIRERADLEATLARLTAAEAIALKYS